VIDPYSGREQTKAKHFILKHYLQALAFKVLRFYDLTYVDGFSGPWGTKTDDFRDSSFRIALSVLQDAQQKILEQTGHRRQVRCFFSESNPEAFARLEAAVAPYHAPGNSFEARTYCGKFEDAISEIQSFIGTSFPLIFIDPTGWTGYPLDKIKPLFVRPKCEVLINFMYEFINRFAYSEDEGIIASFNSILERGPALEKLFREALKSAGSFDFVVSTKIDKSTAERPHFFITYGTKSRDGLKTFREIEYDALRVHARNRAGAKDRMREERSNTTDLFASHYAEIHEATVDELVTEQKALAARDLLATLQSRSTLPFSRVVTALLQVYMLRETNIKDICVNLAKADMVENTWGGGNRKPQDSSPIKLKTKARHE
jgi:three-Cys-motif partner protein